MTVAIYSGNQRTKPVPRTRGYGQRPLDVSLSNFCVSASLLGPSLQTLNAKSWVKFFERSLLDKKIWNISSHSQQSIFFSIPHLMLGGIWGHHVNQWVKRSLTTPLPGLCTSGEILPYMTSLSVGKISPDVQRPGSGVVRLVLTHWLT